MNCDFLSINQLRPTLNLDGCRGNDARAYLQFVSRDHESQINEYTTNVHQLSLGRDQPIQPQERNLEQLEQMCNFNRRHGCVKYSENRCWNRFDKI